MRGRSWRGLIGILLLGRDFECGVGFWDGCISAQEEMGWSEGLSCVLVCLGYPLASGKVLLYELDGLGGLLSA